jgi:hypothetical protein
MSTPFRGSRSMNEFREPLTQRGPPRGASYSTVTLLARLRGWSTSVPLSTAVW